jgi:Domain of unknown function (DUF4185)
MLGIITCLSLLMSCQTAAPTQPQAITIKATSWPEADALFRTDPRWLGGDDAYSIDLGAGRILWLFADSFIATSPAGTRRESALVRNTLAIQHGYDPSSASIKFYWRMKDGKPASFFADSQKVWYWPGHGIRIDGRLLIFLMKIQATKEGLGFAAFGWSVVAIDNPDEEPSQWQLRWLPAPRNDLQVIVGSASVIRIGDFVYAFSAQEPTGKHDVYLVRWPFTKAREADLREPYWWCGEKDGWVSQKLVGRRGAVVFTGAQTEFTVHWDSGLHRFLQVQTAGFPTANMAFRSAAKLTGPWSTLAEFYRPPESARAGTVVYAGKSHPALAGADLVFTYVVNRTGFGDLVNDSSVYYPRFLKGRVEQPGR